MSRILKVKNDFDIHSNPPRQLNSPNEFQHANVEDNQSLIFEQNQSYILEENQPIERQLTSLHQMKHDSKNQKYFQPFKMIKTKKISLKGTRIHFQLYLLGKAIFHSKIKANQKGPIYFMRGGNSHIQIQNPDFIIATKQNFSHFSLYAGNSTENEILTIHFQSSNEKSKPRSSKIDFLQVPTFISKLQSREPTRSTNGEWIIDLCGANTKKSIKTCVYTNSENVPYIIITKTLGSDLNIDVHQKISKEFVFAIGMATYLCTII